MADQPIRRSTTHDERYIHRRIVDHDRVHAVTVYLRRPRHAPEGAAWHGAASFCANGDPFVKAKGRTAARRRFFRPAESGGYMFAVGSDRYKELLALTGCQLAQYFGLDDIVPNRHPLRE